MKIPDYRVGWRLFISKPVGSPLMLLSLSVGFSVCFLLLIFVWYSLGFDSDIPDANRIFLVKDRFNIEPTPAWRDRAPFPIADVAQKSGMVEAAVAVVSRPALPFRVNDQVSQVDLLIVQPSFTTVFAVNAVQGDLAGTLTHPDQIALTVSTAIKLFGKPDVKGKTVQVYGRTYMVGAMLADRAANTTVNYSALAGMNSTLLPDRQRGIFFNYWDAFAGRIYLKLKPGVATESMVNLLQGASDRSPVASSLKPELREKLGNRKVMDIGLDRFTDIYFDDTITRSQDSGPHGSWKIMGSIAVVAFLILFLVVTNHTNFATIEAINRSREIAIRKVLGITKSKLVMQFLFESLTTTLFSTVGGLIITYLLLPIFSDLVNSRLEDVFNGQFVGLTILLGLVVGLLAGAYPALVAIRTKPPAALAGRGSDAVGGFWLRRVLTVFQFSVAIALSSTALVITWQAEFASHESQGFDPTHMLVIDLPDANRNSMRNPVTRNLRDAIAHSPGVVGVATSQDPMGVAAGGGHSEFYRSDGKSANLVNRQISPNFFDVLDVQAIAGRLFNSTLDRESDQMTEVSSIVINAAAARALGYASPLEAVGQMISVDLDEDGMRSVRVVGIAPDIRQESLHELPSPSAYWPNAYASTLTVRYTGNLTDLEDTVSRLVRLYLPDEIVNVRHAQSYFDENYDSDRRTSRLLVLASMFSIFISAFGIYVLSTYSVQRLGKQIAIRKLYGALYGDIAGLVGREFLLLVVMGAAIGLPIAASINTTYLTTFIRQAPVGVWPLILPAMLAIFIAFIATSQQVIKAMKTHPAQVLL